MKTRADFDFGGNTQYGLRWYHLNVDRVASTDKTLMLKLSTPRDSIELYVSPTGKMRVLRTGGGELRERKP